MSGLDGYERINALMKWPTFVQDLAVGFSLNKDGWRLGYTAEQDWGPIQTSSSKILNSQGFFAEQDWEPIWTSSSRIFNWKKSLFASHPYTWKQENLNIDQR